MSNFNSYVRSTLINASNDPFIRAELEGKTLGEVGQKFNLEDEHVAWLDGEYEGQSTLFLELTIEGKTYKIATSGAFPADKQYDTKYLLDCQFYVNQVYKRVNNVIQVDKDGNKLFDESRKVIRFGKPEGGQNLTRRDFWNAPAEEKQNNAAMKLAGA